MLLNHKKGKATNDFTKNMLFTLSLGGGKQHQEVERYCSQTEQCKQTGAELPHLLCSGQEHRAQDAASQ